MQFIDRDHERKCCSRNVVTAYNVYVDLHVSRDCRIRLVSFQSRNFEIWGTKYDKLFSLFVVIQRDRYVKGKQQSEFQFGHLSQSIQVKQIEISSPHVNNNKIIFLCIQKQSHFIVEMVSLEGELLDYFATDT